MVFSVIYLSIYLYIYLVSIPVLNIFLKSRILSTFVKKKILEKSFKNVQNCGWSLASHPEAEADCCMEGRVEDQTTPPTNYWTPSQSPAPGWSLWSIFEARLKYSTAVTPPSLNLSSAAVGFAVSAEGIFSSLVLQGRRPRWIFFSLNLSPRFCPYPSWIFKIPETLFFWFSFFVHIR